MPSGRDRRRDGDARARVVRRKSTPAATTTVHVPDATVGRRVAGNARCGLHGRARLGARASSGGDGGGRRRARSGLESTRVFVAGPRRRSFLDTLTALERCPRDVPRRCRPALVAARPRPHRARQRVRRPRRRGRPLHDAVVHVRDRRRGRRPGRPSTSRGYGACAVTGVRLVIDAARRAWRGAGRSNGAGWLTSAYLVESAPVLGASAGP
jgi:hypothetical protein